MTPRPPHGRMDAAALARQHRLNHLRSLLVMAGIAAWMALVGWLVAGGVGILWSAAGAVLTLLVQPVRSTTLLKALYGAVPLEPVQAPGLYALVTELARRAGLPRVPPLLYIPRLEMIALSTGWGRDSTIALSDGMLRGLPGRELAAVLAHEISHLRVGDIKLLRLAEAAGRLTRVVALFGLMMMALYLPELEAMGGVPLLPLALLAAAPVVSDLLALALSRTREFDADAGAAELTGDPDGLISALRRLSLLQGEGWERLRRGQAFRWLRLIQTHPGTDERVSRLRELAPSPLPQWLVLPEVMLPTGLVALAAKRGWRR
ncbi:MAG TPA: zinc metalloprotease HtpX [Magnetospirillum sp.]|nr:zinc metalloprotease HtpX [Magnetospirillum sp.]